MRLEVTPVFSASAVSYVLMDSRTRCCAVVAPMEETRAGLMAVVRSSELICEWVLGTHVDQADAAAGFAEALLCARTAGPGEGFQHAFANDQAFCVGHVSGRVFLGDNCANYVFNDVIVAGCPMKLMSALRAAQRCLVLDDSCDVLLHQPLSAAQPDTSYRVPLSELKGLPQVVL